MKKRIRITVVVMLAVSGIVALLAQRQIKIRYHVSQSSRLYGEAMAHFDDAALRDQFRDLSIKHSDALVSLGHWRRVDIPIRPLLTVAERTNFMLNVERSIPRDISYYQMWGSTNPALTLIKLWCQSDKIDVWTGFLATEGLLINMKGQQTNAPYSDPAPRSQKR